jgi:Highly conserved protein containing a thioredoxin domain
LSNHLIGQSSPYLLQHAENPVDWYPWCKEAFDRASAEDKPVFLSIGYSTCHWCHVMAHESFEDPETAELLNKYFISVKVDREERPDIDSIYMAVCQAFTGDGGWPTSIFMTADKKPFFAGTYFPKNARFGTVGFIDLLYTISDKWQNERAELLESADKVTTAIKQNQTEPLDAEFNIIESAVKIYKHAFDHEYGGFGNAPKFPAPHNLIFLLAYYERSGDRDALEMAETTLSHMYRGGMFDHIGYGFCRYSTDRFYLIPHFEKMLYDNALLIMVYCRVYWATKNSFYRDVALKTASYTLREMTSPEGGFYSAQDADSDGEEGKYYAFIPSEITDILGKISGDAFNRCYGISESGNFDGKNIPNLIRGNPSNEFVRFLPQIYEYRKKRCRLQLDDKILTSWNCLMIAAMCGLYRVSRNDEYLSAAKRAERYIFENLCENGTLYVSFRNGVRGKQGFLDDYAEYIYSLLALYDATLDNSWLEKAQLFCDKTVNDFFDVKNGGFYLYGIGSEELIMRPKETYDGAVPSGNSVMAYNLTRLYYLTDDIEIGKVLKKQLDFMHGAAHDYPIGHAMYLLSLLEYFEPTEKIVAVLKNRDDAAALPFEKSPDSIIKILNSPTNEYPLKNDKTTFYICRGRSCISPVNDLSLI